MDHDKIVSPSPLRYLANKLRRLVKVSSRSFWAQNLGFLCESLPCVQ
jgi:hypothetical protein